MAKTANEILLEKSISHAIQLDRYSHGAAAMIAKRIATLDKALIKELAERLEGITPNTYTVARIVDVIKEIRPQQAAAFREVYKEIRDELRSFATYEAGYQLSLWETAIPEPVVAIAGLHKINVNNAFAASLSKPFQGKLLRGWAEQLGARQLERVQDAIVSGFTDGLTNDEIIRLLRGTKAKEYTDGILAITRRDAETITRSAVMHVAGDVKQDFYAKNQHMMGAVVWLSTLDTRTTPMCQVRDGKRYTVDTFKPIGHSYEWGAGPGALHFNCRSTSNAVLKSWRELGIDMDEVPASTRASMDGQAPAEMNYADWLKKQSRENQIRVLGATRADMYDSGKIPLDRFYSSKGDLLTIAELYEMGVV